MQLSSRPSSSSSSSSCSVTGKRMLSAVVVDLQPASHKRPRVSRANTPTSAISFVSQPSSNRSPTPQFSPSPCAFPPTAHMRTHAHPPVPCHSPHFSPQPVKPYFDSAVVHDPSLPGSPYYSPPSFSPTPPPADDALCAADDALCAVSAKRAQPHDQQQQQQPQPPPPPSRQFAHEWNEPDLVSAICDHLQSLCDVNNRDGAACSSSKYHAFFSQYRQPFSLSFYISRLVQFCNCSMSAFIVALIFLQRVRDKCAPLAVNHMNVHRLFCTALVLAIKNVDDEVFSNGYYARVGGITLRELNQLEALMLDLLDWNVCCSPERFDTFEKCLLHRLALLLVHSDNDDQLSHEGAPRVTSAA